DVLGGYRRDLKTLVRPKHSKAVQHPLIDDKFRLRFRFDTLNKIFRESKNYWPRDNTPRHARPKNRYPIHPVLGPKQNPVAFLDTLFVEKPSNCTNLPVESGIARNVFAKAVSPANCLTPAEACYFGKEIL